MMRKWFVIAAGISAIGTACGAEPKPHVRERTPPVLEQGPEKQLSSLFSDNGPIVALEGRLDGAVGPATGLRGAAETVNFYDDGYFTNIDLTVRGDNGSAMGIFVLSGGLQALEVGEGVRTCQSDYEDPNSDLNNGGIAASFIGCANDGAPEDGWDYDVPADCTDMNIDVPAADAPEGTVATLAILAHWNGQYEADGQEHTVKATLHLTER